MSRGDALPAEAMPLKIVVENGVVVAVKDSNGDELRHGDVWEVEDRDTLSEGE